MALNKAGYGHLDFFGERQVDDYKFITFPWSLVGGLCVTAAQARVMLTSMLTQRLKVGDWSVGSCHN